MEKLIYEVDKEKGVVQITTLDERWYSKSIEDPITGLPSYIFRPSFTWITGFYPKGIQFMKWLAQKGWDEAEALKLAGGDKGTIVHHASELLLATGELKMSEEIPDHDGNMRQMTPDEFYAVMTFKAFMDDYKPEIVMVNGKKSEFYVEHDEEDVAGMVDFLFRIDGVLWDVDMKISQYIWPSMELQVSGHKHCLPRTYPDIFLRNEDGSLEDIKIGILQVGYRKNKKGYKFTEIEDQWDIFLAVKKIWAKETSGERPHQRDYPLVLTIDIPKEQTQELIPTVEPEMTAEEALTPEKPKKKKKDVI